VSATRDVAETLVELLRKLSNREGATLYMTPLAAFTLLRRTRTRRRSSSAAGQAAIALASKT
jgi:hypothetical protein